ncbi:MAG: crotonobetainyl-CoA--carnitine CoA-transferase [Deltaproteobacteria bacterium]|nr:crotonobetainyl-CoA--carnitine CoA-transferase [Deltaproteobacteria bacterium]
MKAKKDARNKKIGIKTYASADERLHRRRLTEMLHECPIPADQLLSNLGLFLESKNLARILFMDFLFRQIVDVHGVIVEFGTRWGQNLALFSALRGIYDPFNRHRKIIGFDTFSGFPSISTKDGASEMMASGQLAVSQGYEKFLSRILELHEQANPLAHIKKFELRAGDASQEIGKYLEEAPETIIALAYFDFDLYEPTKACLDAIRPRLTKGSVIAFDELNDPDSPGETLALMETLGLNHVKLKRFPHASRVSYFVLE